MAEVASAFVSVVPSAKGFGGKLDSEVGGDVKASGNRLGKVFGAALAAGAVVAGAAIGSYLASAVGAASDLGETQSKVGEIFGGAAAEVEKFASTAATSLGQTRQQALDANATFGIFGKSAGLTGQDLSGFTTELTTLAADLASFNNTSPEAAIEAIGSALRGEAEPIRAFGVLLDDATLRQEALKMGLISTTKEALTPQQKVLAAQAVIMAQTADAQGDFARTSGGLANQQKILSAQWTDMKATVGGALLPAVTGFVTFLNARFIPAVQAIGSVVGPVFNEIRSSLYAFAGAWTFNDGQITSSGLPGFMERLGFVFRQAFEYVRGSVLPVLAQLGGFLMTNVVPAFLGVVSAVQGFVSVALPIVQQFVTGIRSRVEPMLPAFMAVFQGIGAVVVAALGLVQAVVERVTSVVSAIWNRWGASILDYIAAKMAGVLDVIRGALGLVQAIIQTVTAVIRGDWSAAWQGILAILRSAWATIQAVVRLATTILRGIITGAWAVIRTLTSTAWEAVRSLIAAAWERIKTAVRQRIGDVVSYVRDLPGRMRSALGGLGSLLYSAGRDMISGLINGIKDMAGAAAGAAMDVARSAVSGVKGLLGINSPSKVFMEIGRNTGEGMALGLADSGRLVDRAADALIPSPNLSRPSVRLASDASRAGAGADPGPEFDIDELLDGLRDIMRTENRRLVDMMVSADR